MAKEEGLKKNKMEEGEVSVCRREGEEGKTIREDIYKKNVHYLNFRYRFNDDA